MRFSDFAAIAVRGIVAAVVALLPYTLHAQRPVRDTTVADSAAKRDSTGRRSHMLQAVTITTTRAMRDEPAAALNIAPSFIRLTPATNSWDLVRQVAGVEVHDQGQGPGFASNASVRGFSSDHSTDLALWIDGVPINEPVNGHAEGYDDWSLIFPAAIRDFDVIKGPWSALFGNFALAGVVNVRTLERMRGTEGYVSGGSYGRAEGTVMTGFDRGSAGGVFGLRALREDGWRPNSDYGLLQGHARVVRNLSPNATLDAGLELYGARWNSPGFLSVSQFDQGQFDNVSDVTDGGFKRRAQERVSLRVLRGGSVWRSTLYATQSRWQLFLTTPPEGGGEEGSGAQTEEEDSRYGLGATSAWSRALPNGELTVGVEGRFDHARYQNWLDSVRLRSSAQELDANEQLSGGVFMQARNELGTRTTLSLGARWDGLRTSRLPVDSDAISATQNAFSPKLGVTFRLTSALAAYANVSRGFRSPDNINLHPSLGLITAWSYEGGLKFDRSRLALSAAAFQMDVSDEQQFSEICACAVSGGASRRRGIELSGQAHVVAPLTITAEWTMNDATYRRFEDEDGSILRDRVRVFNTARYVGVVAASFAPTSSRWRLRVASNVVGPYTPFDEAPGFELPTYALLHMSGGVRVGRSEIEFGLRNVLDRRYPELRAGGFVAPGQPRSVFANVRYALQ